MRRRFGERLRGGRRASRAERGRRGRANAASRGRRESEMRLELARYHTVLDLARSRHDPPRTPPVLDYPFPRRRARATVHRGRAGHPVAADAAAVRARPHQPVAAARTTAVARSSTAATATRRRARCGNGTSRRRWAARRSRASSPRTTTPTTSATRAWLAARFGAPIAMTHAEFLTAHAVLDQRGDATRSPTPARCSAAHGMSRTSTCDALAARGNRYRARRARAAGDVPAA